MVKESSLQSIEYEIAMLVRLITANHPKLGSLDRSEYLILSELHKNGPVGINEIAHHLMLNISTASRQISNLETKAYITRFPDTNNGRISLVQITEEGKAILQKVQKARYKGYEEMLQDWEKQDLEKLEIYLQRLNQDFKRWGS
ncbi:MarR family winged helix-turn-helix transcriptional regulator [Niallia sp. NCCP-28]|uniref:MarR family winged helix-turn-helix transcriptional regulator n=1 Tax=Niallia sp. NCCP-28 TaxID=2934712 RepID=UPI0020C138F7|nr:MarR family transcriptional regulator [Niallia sp. NCCP-28]